MDCPVNPDSDAVTDTLLELEFIVVGEVTDCVANDPDETLHVPLELAVSVLEVL